MTDLYERKVFFSKEDKRWVAVAPELPGCSAHGKTPRRAYAELDSAIGLWVAEAKANRWPVPKPVASRETAGRILLRLPKELHKEYLSLALQEGVSLNQFMLYVLARYRDLGATARHLK